jgi:glycosyltransferase involved in cell wall biosynthesis
MRILFLTPYLSENYGGVTRVTRELAQTLGKLGIFLDLITTLASDKTIIDQPVQTWVVQEHFRVKYFPCVHRGDFIFSWSLLHWLKTHAADYDLVHTHTVFCPLVSWATRICHRQKIPYVITPHGMLEPWAFSYKAWKKKLYYQLIEKHTLSRAVAIQGIASTEVTNFDLYSAKTTKFLIPNGIHGQDFQHLPSPQIFYSAFPDTKNKTLILFLARIDPKKGLDLLALAFAQVKQQFPTAHLVIAGPDSIDFQATAEKYFIQAGCRDAVTFTGMLSGELKHSALAAAQIYVSPSYSEGFSMSVLEGMASGLPCVITTGCNFPEASNVTKIVPVEQQEIANALTWCLANPGEAQTMGNQAQQFIFEKYTWDKIAQQMITVYSWILNQGPKPNCVMEAAPQSQKFPPTNYGI